jgi:transcriptional regulator with XRE-family HTH domain
MATQSAATFGDLLRRYRLAAGLTQEELAEKAQVSPRAISDLERGLRSCPWRETIHLLAEALTLAPAERAQAAAGVWLVELAPLTDPSLVSEMVAAVFGLRWAKSARPRCGPKAKR